LQASVAFFRTDNKSHVAPVKKAAKPVRKAPVARPTFRAPRVNTVAHQQDRVRGFALDLDQGGPDADDLDFERVA
jgi:methyl-accepting chemotaxis protein